MINITTDPGTGAVSRRTRISPTLRRINRHEIKMEAARERGKEEFERQKARHDAFISGLCARMRH